MKSCALDSVKTVEVAHEFPAGPHGVQNNECSVPQPCDNIGLYAKHGEAVEWVPNDLHYREGKKQKREAAAGLGLGHAVQDGPRDEEPGHHLGASVTGLDLTRPQAACAISRTEAVHKSLSKAPVSW